MTSLGNPVRVPDEAQRLAARVRPAGSPVMYQEWRDLLFLHWEYSAARIQENLPEGLFVDTWRGKAYLGVVPFLMRSVRPRFLPALPGISNFMELNLRTYVHDRAGVPGVWFYSLDANQRLAVEIARRLFHLPYEHATMETTGDATSGIDYRSTRHGASPEIATSAFAYRPGPALPASLPGSLEFFLVERYRLYSRAGDGLRRGAVSHPPYSLCRAVVPGWDEHLLTLNGFVPTGRPPDHIAWSRGVNVSIHRLERV